MIRPVTNADLFDGAGDIRAAGPLVDACAAKFPLEVTVTTRDGAGSVWSTTIVISGHDEQEPRDAGDYLSPKH